MSQPKKRDIADFFRPYARAIPRKRPSPDFDGDTIVARSAGSKPRTPSPRRKIRPSISRQQQHEATPTNRVAGPLITPRSGKRLSIPIRSPAGGSALKPVSARKSLFESSTVTSHDTPKPSSSFSFADAPATSRKVVEHGKLVEVRDSDDSDNESLLSLTDIFACKDDGAAAKSPQKGLSSRQEEERCSLLSLYTGGRSNPILKKDRLRELHALEQANKFDLTALLDEDRKDEERRAALAWANAELVDSGQQVDASRQAEMDKKMLAAILQGNSSKEVDPEELSRLTSAVDRTEAFAAEKTFSFFRRDGSSLPPSRTKARRELPTSSIRHSLWKPQNTSTRDRMYLSGFMIELAEYNRLDDEALRWTFDSVITEQRVDLRQSYIDCISAASPSWTRSNVTPDDIQHIFGSLGADPHALRDATLIEARYHLQNELGRQDYKSLLTALKLMDVICPDLDFATLSKLTSITSRLTLDAYLMSNNLVCHAVESLLNQVTNHPNLASRTHVHERLLSDLGANLTEPTLQSQFLAHFIPTSTSATKLRTQLASTFLFGVDLSQKMSIISSTISPLVSITDHLSKHPLFTTTISQSRLSDPSSYSSLTSKTAILDAALPPAPSSFPSRSDQQHFNSDVDALADHIHALFVSIADTGASHMRRTEAKDALQALHYRLLYQVRTKPRRKRHVFDRERMFSVDSDEKERGAGSGMLGKGGIRDTLESEQMTRGGDFMNKFLKKRSDVNKEDHSMQEATVGVH